MNSKKSERLSFDPLDWLAATRLSACLCVAAKLKIADLLEKGPMSSEALAQVTGTHPYALRRVMRALTKTDYFREESDGALSLGPLGARLLSDAPDSVRDWVMMFHDVHFFRSHAELQHTVKTGESAFEHVTGLEMFPYFGENPEVGATFDRAMTFETAHIARAVIEAFDFSACRKVADVGGSHGTLLAAILQAHPEMEGVLFDRSRVIAAAEQALAAAGLAERTECVGGSFFKSVPAGCDAYILKNIIHDWDDEHSVSILSNCRTAMNENGRILIVERLLQAEQDGSLQAICADLDMLVLGGADNARERTVEEYRALCHAADCDLVRVLPTESHLDYFVLEVVAR